MNRKRVRFPTDDIDLVLSFDGFVVAACGCARVEASMVRTASVGVCRLNVVSWVQ